MSERLRVIEPLFANAYSKKDVKPDVTNNFDDAVGFQYLSKESLDFIDELARSGLPPPAVLSNNGVKAEM